MSSSAPSIPAHSHYSEQERITLFQCLEAALRSLSQLHDDFVQLRAQLPTPKTMLFLPVTISDTPVGKPYYCKKDGRRLLYAVSPQNITLVNGDFTPSLNIALQAGVLTLLPFVEGTQLKSNNSITDSAPVVFMTIATDERLI